MVPKVSSNCSELLHCWLIKDFSCDQSAIHVPELRNIWAGIAQISSLRVVCHTSKSMPRFSLAKRYSLTSLLKYCRAMLKRHADHNGEVGWHVRAYGCPHYVDLGHVVYGTPVFTNVWDGPPVPTLDSPRALRIEPTETEGVRKIKSGWFVMIRDATVRLNETATFPQNFTLEVRNC